LPLSAARFLPIIVAIILAGSLVYLASANVASLPSSANQVTLRVGYPDSLDESDISDLYAYTNILPAEGIHVIPTFYDAPPLSYKGLISGQQDIAFDTSAQTIALGPGGSPSEQTTCVTAYAMAGVFLTVAGQGITSPSQMIGKVAEDFGVGTSTRSLDLYDFAQAGIPVSQDAPKPGTVELVNGGGNVQRVHDLESGKAAAITVDDFILADFMSPTVNNTANGGPFHVLFYAPKNYYDNCFAVRDSWLQQSTGGIPNTKLIVTFIEAIIQAQRDFISNPSLMVSFAESQLPLTAPSEINFTSTFYPGHFTYWPYGAYNLIGPWNVTGMYANTQKYFIDTGIITTAVPNSTVSPYGVVNSHFEAQALAALGPYTYPGTASWVTPSFKSWIQATVPTSLGTIS
jgi:hypothetical protein